jgi:hypothetical protein
MKVIEVKFDPSLETERDVIKRVLSMNPELRVKGIKRLKKIRYERVPKQIIETDPETGEEITKTVYEKKEVYEGEDHIVEFELDYKSMYQSATTIDEKVSVIAKMLNLE